MIVICQKSFPQGFRQESLAQKVIIINLHHKMFDLSVLHFCAHVGDFFSCCFMHSPFSNADAQHPIYGSDLIIVASSE
jgi:hypothetical protein